MHPNQALIQQFYTAFAEKNYETMKECYHPEASFTDEAFVNLTAREAGLMWEMLIKSGKDLTIEFSNVQGNDTQGSAFWVATYTFARTKRKVVNRIQANFTFKEGKILHHRDRFNFHGWARQAFGMTGLLLGWTPFFKNKVRTFAQKRLSDFAKNATSA